MKLEATFETPADRAAGNDPPLGAMVEALERRLGASIAAMQGPGPRLADAMGYSLLLPAKRARGILSMLTAASWGLDWTDALDIAASLEMVHAASLILDDLPAMDNAALRRGKRSNHLVYGEATAILSAVGLMNEGFAIIAATSGVAAAYRVELSASLGRAIGPRGLTGGQDADLGANASAKKWSLHEVELIHAAKTGALFEAAAEMGTMLAGISGLRLKAMGDFGMQIGIAFQGFDDLIDARAAPADAGKDVGKDKGKPTVVSLIGCDRAEIRANELVRSALGRLSDSGADRVVLEGYVMALIDGLRQRGLGLTSKP
ncbi:MAG: hypothetical protein C0511_09800 [Hyphomicrobium sp.]|nr:hypothetical protein [Hyphomicrobium sp.]